MHREVRMWIALVQSEKKRTKNRTIKATSSDPDAEKEGNY